MAMSASPTDCELSRNEGRAKGLERSLRGASASLALMLLLAGCADGSAFLGGPLDRSPHLVMPPEPGPSAPATDAYGYGNRAPDEGAWLQNVAFDVEPSQPTSTAWSSAARVGAADTMTVAQASPAEPAAAGTDLGALAQKTNNPISDAWLLITQNDYTLLGGKAVDGHEVLNVTKFQPVLSAPLFDGSWNFVVRPVLQWTSMPFDQDAGKLFGVSPNDIAGDNSLRNVAQDPFGRTNGLGDTVLLTLVGPNTDSGWIFAGGISQIFPTASEDVLGQEKWQAGPAALVVRLGDDYGGFGFEHFNFGLLAQQWWSYAGDSDRSGTNQADIQYFINYKQNATRLIGMTPNISINWDQDGDLTDKIAFPIGLGTIDLFMVGKLPVRWGLEAQYYLTGPDSIRREANFRFFIAPIIPNLLK